MVTKRFEVAEHKCDRCGAEEVVKQEHGVTESAKSKGLHVTLGERSENAEDSLVEPEFQRVVKTLGYPPNALGVRLWLCPGCRGELATFLNAKQ